MLIERGRDAGPASPVIQDAPGALAEARSGQRYRGGWIVNAAMTGQLPQSAPSPQTAAEEAARSPAKVAETNHPEVRRGGWMVAQAYALSDLQRAPISAVASRIDDAV